MTIKWTPNKFKIPLFLGLILIVAGLGASYYAERFFSGKTAIESVKIDSNVALSLNSMHQTSSRNGRKEWTLTASSARLFKEKDQAEMSDVSVVFFLENKDEIHLTSAQGILDTKHHNMKFSGNVVVVYSGYTLETDELQYEKKRHIIYSTVSTRITGQDAMIEADSFQTDLNRKQTRLAGNVKGRLGETFHFFDALDTARF